VRFPDLCPSCKTPIEAVSNQAIGRCSNPNCAEKKFRQLAYFASPQGLNIRGIGEGTLQAWIQAGVVNNPADLFRLPPETPNLNNHREDALHQARNLSTAEDLYRALGIPGIGTVQARRLATFFPNPGALALWESTRSEPDLPDALRRSLENYFTIQEHRNLVKDLADLGIGSRKESSNKTINNTIFDGKVFVLTGTITTLTRAEAKNLIEAAGGIVRETLSEKTNFLIVGDKPGRKLQEAQKRGIPIISEAEFLRMLSR
jgi:DNA ligase (NAD+)